MHSLDDWQAGGSFMNWRGQRIFVRSVGTGEAMLLIHGFPTSSWDWWQLEALLRNRFRLVSFDLLGFGLSDKPGEANYTIAAQADLAEAVLAHFSINQCRVLAHDYGVTVAQELLARVQLGQTRLALQHVALLNGGLFPEAHRPRLIQKLLASPLGGVLSRLTRFKHFQNTMNQICARALPLVELQTMWALLERQNGRRVIPKLLAYMAERRRFRQRWVGALIETTVPLRLINGTADPISGAQLVKRYRELLTNADVVELAGVGHYPQLEAPAEVAAALGS